MRDRITWGAIGLVVGVVGAGLLTKSCADRAIAELRAHAKRQVVAVTGYADSLRRVADSLAQRQARVVTVVQRDTTAAAVARRALVVAQTARDSTVALLQEVAALRSANVGLFEALALANAATALERARGDSLQRIVADLGQRIANLKPRPRWLTISFEVVKLGAAAYGGYELGRASMR